MLANLSFKTKLLSLLVAAIVGFIVLTVVAMQGLSSQQTANDQLRTLSKIQASSDQLSIRMLEITDSLRDVKEDGYEDYLNHLNEQVNQNTTIISTNIEHAHSQELKDIIAQTQTQINNYSSALLDLVKQRHLIGFEANTGLRGEVDKLGVQLGDEIGSLSLLKREFANVRKAEAGYLFDPTKDNLNEFTTTFGRLDTRIENFGFQDTIGKTSKTYRETVLKYGQEYQHLEDLEKIFSDQKNLFNNTQVQANDLIEQKVLAAEESAKRSSKQANITVLVVSIAVAIISALLMIGIGRSVNNTLKGIVLDLNKVKEGDMSSKAQVNTRRNDEFDLLGSSLNEMTQGLGGVLKDVVSTTSSVSSMVTDLNSAIGDITRNNHSVNQRTHSLASATDDISNRINQLSDTTETLRAHSNDTYESAKTGASTIRVVLESLSDTVTIVNETDEQLNELGRLSGNIDNVIGMINDLANQTNLLALNAAIEAARAGEAGRGFSVVADEVRSLAEKTVDATSKITDIVSTIQTSTQAAIKTMASGQSNLKVIEENGGKAEEAMRDIESNAMTGSHSAESMATAIQDVASTAIQMSTEMEQIAQQLNEDTRSIDILAEKTRQIQELAEQLSGKTQVFTLA